MRKLAVLRDNVEKKCPFGLPIPYGCKTAGKLIHQLDQDPKAAQTNLSKVEDNNEPGKCDFAGDIIKDEFVACQAPDTDPSFPKGSPRFYRPLAGVGLEGLNTVPLGFYNDNSIDRGYYYGMYSVESMAAVKKKYNDIIKQNTLIKYHNIIKQSGLLKVPQADYQKMLTWTLGIFAFMAWQTISKNIIISQNEKAHYQYMEKLLDNPYFEKISSLFVYPDDLIKTFLNTLNEDGELEVTWLVGKDINDNLKSYKTGLFIFKLDDGTYNYKALNAPLQKNIDLETVINHLTKDLDNLAISAREFQDKVLEEGRSGESKAITTEYHRLLKTLEQKFHFPTDNNPSYTKQFDVNINNKIHPIKVSLINSPDTQKYIYDKESWAGLWQDNTIFIYVNPEKLKKLSNSLNNNSLNSMAHDIANTLRHELQHAVQFLAKEEFKTGLPSKKLRSKDYDIYGRKIPEFSSPNLQNSNPKIPSEKQNHNLRDIEFYTDLTDAISELKVSLNKIPPMFKSQSIKYGLGELSEDDFKNLIETRWGNIDYKYRMESPLSKDYTSYTIINMLAPVKHYFDNLKTHNFENIRKLLKKRIRQ
jgi:hypothetical protein